ncbi:IS3 family transposase [Vibrio artabrorum]|uniref:IS3 family transposase n=1 Tax=Vibrio artabrorum TaxID=446374 RepID=A0ABT8CR34_9VIBR|nr:DDE-type integrase/transposase/recombinase [Vibrio artabrorum]MDN3702748.1 IS3 family transposase [Vibrio artabrorum]
MSNREIIAWQMARRLVLQLVTEMLDKALARLKPSEKPLLHSDQGWHYQHARYRKCWKRQGIVQSMSRKGNCLDNAAMESFGILKSEFFHLKRFDNIEQLEAGIEQYIHYYNHERIKLS